MRKNHPAVERVFILTGSDSEVETRPTNNCLFVGLGGGTECSTRAGGGEGRAPRVLR